MKRTKNLIKSEDRYPIQEEPIVLSKAVMDLLLGQEEYSNLIGLYCFYYYTAKWQGTVQPRCTTHYTADGLHWTEIKVRKMKKRLIELGLIKDVIQRDSLTKTIQAHFIRVKFIWESGSIPSYSETESVGFNSGKCFNTNNKRDCFENTIFGPLDKPPTGSLFAIVPSLFETFWKHFPKKRGKGQALSAWEKICKKSVKDRPTWRIVKMALIKQKDSELWKLRPEYIPNASTWLNQKRWLDDPKEMKVFNNNKEQKFIIDDGIKYVLGEDGRYRHAKSGNIYIP